MFRCFLLCMILSMFSLSEFEESVKKLYISYENDKSYEILHSEKNFPVLQTLLQQHGLQYSVRNSQGKTSIFLTI